MSQRRGWLKNGNPPGDFNKAPRCGAKTRKGYSMPPAGHAEWKMPVSRWKVNRPPDSGGDGKDAPKQI